MPVLCVNEMDVAVLLGQREYLVYKVKRDNELLMMMYEAGKDFWENYVLKDIPPPSMAATPAKTTCWRNILMRRMRF